VVRSVLSWRIRGEILVGTCHLPEAGAVNHPTGVLLLNSGPTPRAGNGDTCTRVADGLALRGVPVFRFDAPGLGDSSGSAPLDLESYWSEVLQGRNDQATLTLIRRIKIRYGIANLLVGGLCAGAVTALRVTDMDPDAIAGVIILEPKFRMGLAEPPRSEDQPQSATPGKLHRLVSAREWLQFLTGESPYARAARPLRTALLGFLGRWGGEGLPKDANVPLVEHWQASLARGVPSLVVVAEDQIADHYVPRVLAAMSAAERAGVTFVRVANTNHFLTGATARGAVLAALDDWIGEHFKRRGTAAPQRSAAQLAGADHATLR
jgi:alpha-beta hydrolase superfamily lysophospholipase